MRPNPIHRSLWRPVTWMGMERLPGALWILGTGMLVVTGLMFAGTYIITGLVIAAGAAGTVGLARLAERDPAFFRVMARRLRYSDAYPAKAGKIATDQWKGRADG